MSSDPSFLFLCASTPWVGALAENLAKAYPTAVVDIYDWFTLRRARARHWPVLVPSAVIRETWAYPPTYLSYFRSLFAMLGRARLGRLIEDQICGRNLAAPWIVCPYPWYYAWVRDIPCDRLIYYNLDDYVQYYPMRRWATVERQEGQLIRNAVRTFCLSQYQVDKLKAKYPDCADRVFHFPLGVVGEFLNQSPEVQPSNRTVGYIGNLTARIDWGFVQRVVMSLPDLTFVFVGAMTDDDYPTSGWKDARAEVFALPNVRHVPEVTQAEVYSYYREFHVNWVPYDVHHPFNKASCPTKIMDGLASGRPLVSTAIPECRLYPEWIAVVETCEEACVWLRRATADAPNPLRSVDQVAFAAKHTWAVRASEFFEMLPSRWRPAV